MNKKQLSRTRNTKKTTKRRSGKAKYNKLFIELWKCGNCDFEWAYNTLKCPLCASSGFSRII